MEKNIKIPINAVKLEGFLTIPKYARGLILFAHGSGSSRLSPRNNYVAQVLQNAGLGTLLFDLMTEKEDEVYLNRFNMPFLAERLKAVTKWVKKQHTTKDMNIGYFGASTGAAAAIICASEIGPDIKAIVSRGGRPDLAEGSLPDLKSPTLLIVGGNDDAVISLNRTAYDKMKCKKELKIIPGATHLFEEPGTLEQAADMAADWFKEYLA